MTANSFCFRANSMASRWLSFKWGLVKWIWPSCSPLESDAKKKINSFWSFLKILLFFERRSAEWKDFFLKSPSLGFIFVMSRYIHYTDSIFTKLFLSIFRWKEYNFFRIRLYHQHLLASIWDWHSDVEHQGHSSQIGNCVT